MQVPLPPHTPLSSPGLTGRSSTPRLLGSTRTASAYWIPAFAGMTENLPPASFRGGSQSRTRNLAQ
ncbi:hypothetical protein ABIA43_000801 [Bradyrhizobium sp. USDA 328]